MKGFVQVYTGNGKGKTTAALGLALRAAGAGLHVFIAQFAKGIKSSELEALKKFNEFITIKQYGSKKFIETAGKFDMDSAGKGLADVRQAIVSGDYDLVILDEANVAIDLKLFSPTDLIEIINLRPDNVEIVITGRNAHPIILERADLVTEMKEVKHYFHKGVKARKGIEK